MWLSCQKNNPAFKDPLGGRVDEQEQAAGIVQANLRKSKIVNDETEGRADVASIAADYPSYAVGRSAPILQCIFKLLKLGIRKNETSVGLFFAREWLEILDFDAGSVPHDGVIDRAAERAAARRATLCGD